jgi:arylsulfatase
MAGPVVEAARALLVALAGVCLGSLGCRAPAPPLELLLLISVDTLRADHLGVYGSERELTPALDALARQSTVFTAAYAPAPFTLPSIAALLSGRYPEELGISRNESALPASVPTLASALRERGWRTGAVVSNFVLRDACGLAAGFDVYDDRFPAREATRRWPERAAPDTTEAALRTLDRCADGTGAPCFLWVHYQDPHGPYTPDPAQRARLVEAERAAPDGRRLLPVNRKHTGRGGIPRYQYVDGAREVAFYRAGYAAEIAAVDAAIGELLAALEARGLADRSIVVFAADHGEGLGENDYWFAHGELLTEPLLRVPLMIRIPGVPPARRDDVVSLVDVAPTLLRRVVDAAPDGAAPGRDLLAPGAEDQHSSPYLASLDGGEVSHYGLVEGEFKFVTSLRDGVWDGALYRRGRDDTDLAAGAPQVAAAMRRRLEAVRAGLARPGETRQQLSAEDVERLEALGYLPGERGAEGADDR